MNKRQKGFTLVEMMVAVAVVAILSRIAYVAYTKQVIKSNRTDAEQMLLQMAQAEERYYATHDTYSSSTTSIGFPSSPQTPVSPATPVYTLKVLSASSLAYTLEADVAGTSLNPHNLNVNNGLLQLKSDGTKCWDKDNSGSCSNSENTWNQ